MAFINQSQQQYQKQIQKQTQRLSHVQIQALNVLSMSVEDLNTFIHKEVEKNPALEIIRESKNTVTAGTSHKSNITADDFQRTLEATEDRAETLQSHLMHQLNSIALSQDELELSQKLIYNLDANGFYGASISPETLLDKSRPVQNKEMLVRCMDRIQRMDPTGTCCKGPEESLYVQAKIDTESPKLALFILDGHIELLNPPEPDTVYDKLIDYQESWHRKKFAGEILLDTLDFDEEMVSEAINYILHLNIHPAQGYTKDTNADYEAPDVVLSITKEQGYLAVDDWNKGLVSGDRDSHFKITYASGDLPEIGIVPELSIDKDNFKQAQEFLEILKYRESTMILQGCAIVSEQKDFFLTGSNLKVLTRKTIAGIIGVHESTVSRMTAKKNGRYFQTDWGIVPASYFFTSGVSSSQSGDKISSQVIKQKIQEILEASKDTVISDQKLADLLNEQGIKIARRTVAKYRGQSGIRNSYKR